jgi:hypothetical protein
MSDVENTPHGMAMDGFSKVQPLQEGYLVKGGVNATSQIAKRPPAPPILNPKPIVTQPSTNAGNKPGA